MLVLSFQTGAKDPIRNSFYDYYMPLAEIKGFNVLIDNKPFFGQPVKTNKNYMNILWYDKK